MEANRKLIEKLFSTSLIISDELKSTNYDVGWQVDKIWLAIR